MEVKILENKEHLQKMTFRSFNKKLGNLIEEVGTILR